MTRLLIATLLLLPATACGGSVSGGGGGGTGANPNSLLYTQPTAGGDCQAADEALVEAVTAGLGARTLEHAYVAQQGDVWIVAGTLVGAGLAGSDVGTFAVTSLDPATAEVYAVGGNANSFSEWEDASAAGVDASLDDDAAKAVASCAKQR